MKQLYLFIVTILIALSAIAQRSNDCVNSILVCNNLSLGITPNGAGFDEFSLPNNNTPSCFNFNTDTAWFRIEIETSGSFTFEIIPDQNRADYDFAVFGPAADCSNLGTAIRCSSTNPDAAGVTGNTGLNLTATDTEEGPGPNGDGFLRAIDATAGDVYYIVVGLAVGNGGFSINAAGTATLPPAPVANAIQDFSVCDLVGPIDGITELDFTSLNTQVLNGQTGVDVSYFETLGEANENLNALTFPYTNTTARQTFFARLERQDSECTDFTSFTVNVQNQDNNRTEPDVILCTTLATQSFNFDSIINTYVSNASAFNITYHTNAMDAENDSNPVSSNFLANTSPQPVFIKIIDPSNTICRYIIDTQLYVAAPPVLNNPTPLESCDNDFDGFTIFTLSRKRNEITAPEPDTNYNFFYYATVADRDTDLNRLPEIYTNTIANQTIYVRVEEITTRCVSDSQFNLIVLDKPVLLPQPDIFICLDALNPTTIGVPVGFDFYSWSTGESGAAQNTIDITRDGTYTVTVTNADGCQTSLSIVALPSETATITNIEVVDFQGNNGSAVITVTGTGDYEYAVDDSAYQESNTVTNLDNGFHLARVRDKNGCGIAVKEFVVLDYPRFFTPNNDGFNDFWTLVGLNLFPDAQLFIFDRYGKLLKQLAPDNIGWDGTYLGAPLPSSTYWFTLEIPNKPSIKGYFAMKR